VRLAREDLADFIKCYNPQNRDQRKPSWDETKNPDGAGGNLAMTN
jgi:hypothetical protein